MAAGVFWIAGALADGSTRTLLWLVALAIDYGAPAVTYWVPWSGRVLPSAWQVSTAHFAERFQLFVIIALGESIVITGATASELDLDTRARPRSRWRSCRRPRSGGSTSTTWPGSPSGGWSWPPNRTLMARDAYTYLHVLIIAGVIVSAVGDELIIAHPTDKLPGYEVAAVAAGPAIYLLAHTLFRLRLTGTVGAPRLTGLAACVAIGLVGTQLTALVLGGALVAVLVAVIVWEYARGRARRARGEPTPLDRLAEKVPQA